MHKFLKNLSILLLFHFTKYYKGPGHVTFWRLCTDQELEKEKLAKMARKSQSNESITDLDVPTITRQDDDESEEQSGVVKLLLDSVVEDQRQIMVGSGGID